MKTATLQPNTTTQKTEARMRSREALFNDQALFDSLSAKDKEQIDDTIRDNAIAREARRYAQLANAETLKHNLVLELETLEESIDTNNQWFHSAKAGTMPVTTSEVASRTAIAAELYSRKRAIVDRLLPEADIHIASVVLQIERDESQESLYQRIDLERILTPFFESRQRERAQERATQIAAQRQEDERQRAAEETQRQRQYEEFIELFQREQTQRRQQAETARRNAIASHATTRRNAIASRAVARQIPYLVHFTPIANVASILRTGLRSRNALTGEHFVWTDRFRTDGWLDWISASVSFPNYKMFYKKRSQRHDIDGWAVLRIKKEALWELDCRFIPTNAARTGVRMFSDTKWSSPAAFEEMFGNTNHRLGIPEYYTTDPQAEVMIRDEIPCHYIDMIIVQNSRDFRTLGNLSSIAIEEQPRLFEWRQDYQHWLTNSLALFPNHTNAASPI